MKSPEPLIPYYLYDRICSFQSMNTVKQRKQFIEQQILKHLSDVRLFCLSRLVNICKKIVREQHEVTIIDLSYELSNVILRDPTHKKWKQLDPQNNENENIDDIRKLKILLDPETIYCDPLPPSHKNKRAEMAFITYILSNHVPILNDKKFVNNGPKLIMYKSNRKRRKSHDIKQTHIVNNGHHQNNRLDKINEKDDKKKNLINK